MRIGFGYDVHRLVRGHAITMGGVRIPHTHGLSGHSDADALLHAIADALLGASALGDIGLHFPSSDEQYKDADSSVLLQVVAGRVQAAGYRIANVDATVALERPRLHPHIGAMRAAIASAIGVSKGQVSVKATTTDTMGFVGRQEGIAAWAVCLLESWRDDDRLQ